MKLPTTFALASLAAFALVPLASAQNATTDPVGFVTTTIAASADGIAPKVTFISPVLLQASGVNGTIAGTLSSVTSSTITVTGAGWTTSELSTSLAYLLVKSGTASGLVLPISSNTVDTATLDTLGTDITTLGVAAGDSFQLIQGDNVLSMFGTPAEGVVGGNAAAYAASQTDKVVIRDAAGNLRTLYYNTDYGQWRRVGSSSNQGTLAISPYSGVSYYRIGTTALSYVNTGSVPVQSVKLLVPTSGSAFFARIFPTDGTLSSFGFQTLSGWATSVSAGSVAAADKVVTTDVSGNVRSFYYNGTKWLRAGSSTDQGSVQIPIGSSVYTVRQGTGTAQILEVPLPYNL